MTPKQEKEVRKENLEKGLEYLEGVPGFGLDPNFIAPKPEYNYSAVARYMKKTGKEWKDFTDEEKEMFRL